jgi:hypothetical protein
MEESQLTFKEKRDHTKGGWNMEQICRKGFIMYFIVWFVAIGCLPTEGMAMRIPSDATITESGSTTRDANLQKIQAKLESKLVAQRLSDVGLTPTEAQERLSNLSDEQLHQVAQNLDGLQPGGGVLILILAIIGAVVVVMAIIGLAKSA